MLFAVLQGGGRDVGNTLRRPFVERELLSGVDFGNEALNAQESAAMAGQVDSSDITAFRERLNAKRHRA
ncbi:hypothetical protein RY26_16495 [Pseudomonas fluorescens]|nr:hypothetical protein RY26_16495 [Pseudomonas fluorescens]